MDLGELAKLIAGNPLAAYAALTTMSTTVLAGLLIQSYRARIRTAEVHAYDLAKMMEIQSRTLDVVGKMHGVLALPSVQTLLNGNGRRFRDEE